MRGRIHRVRLPLAFGWLLLLGGMAAAQVIAPPPPPRYRVELSYRIVAAPANRVGQFLDFVKALEAAGFKKDPGPENEAEDATRVRMTGSAPAAKARGLLDVRRVRRLLLIPEGFKPDDPKQPVGVVIDLLDRYALPRQRLLARQTVDLLAKEGFREAIGYDHRGHSRLVGWVPFEQVPRLLLDLRGPRPDALDEPLRRVWPVRVVEVRPEPAGVAPAREYTPPKAPPAEQRHLLKISPELQQSVRGAPNQFARIEVLLTDPLLTASPDTRRKLPRTGDVVDIEYAMGQYVVLIARLGAVPEMAKLPFVQALRFPQASSLPAPAGPADPAAREAARRRWSVDAMHRAGHRGSGVRLAVIADDFRNYRSHLGKGLPAATRLIDLTAERDPTLEPDPVKDEPGAGPGTLQALAAAEAAPEAELLLVRIGTNSAHQLHEVLRHLAGDTAQSPALRRRVEEMRDDEERLNRELTQLLVERRTALATAPGSDDVEGLKRREAYLKRQKDWDARDEALRRRRQRYLQYLEDLKRLRGVRVAVNGLTWDEGYPVNGTGPLARRLDGWPRHCALWLQATGDTGGQAWAGLFLDEDGNGRLEFAPAGQRLPAGRWSAEMNFLGWRPHGAATTADLPAGTVVRLSVQWSEAHDGLLRRLGEDPYRQPLAHLGFIVLRQRDPTGQSLSSDAMEVVARSAPLQQRVVHRLHVAANSSVYEHTLTFTVPAAGRYAVMLEGSQPVGVRPPGDETLPSLVRRWELRPRLFVQTLDAKSRGVGRPVWADHAGGEGVFGAPADATTAVTVGAADAAGQRRASSPHGSPLGMRLLHRPELLVPDGLLPGGTGTAMSAAFAAGVATSAITAGGGAEAMRREWQGVERREWAPPRDWTRRRGNPDR